MKQSFAIALLSGVLIMNMGMFCHSLCAGGGHEKTRMQHSAAHKMKMAQVMPQGESCPLSHQMTHHKGQGHSHGAKQTLPETSLKYGCSAEDEASSAYEVTLLKPIEDLMPHFKTVSTVTPQHTLFSSREPIPSVGPPEIIS
ncbi:MAG: hypothetical protein HZA18_08515 [Nitrospirae bacterium]|nr:hypothetical protein [Nitrospirota bacterium]